MAIVRGKFLLRVDIWFEDYPEKMPKVDVVYYYGQWQPPSIQGIEFDESYTLLLNLAKTEDELWQNINKEYRKKLNGQLKKI